MLELTELLTHGKVDANKLMTFLDMDVKNTARSLGIEPLVLVSQPTVYGESERLKKIYELLCRVTYERGINFAKCFMYTPNPLLAFMCPLDVLLMSSNDVVTIVCIGN